jgi:hypothetical protein
MSANNSSTNEAINNSNKTEVTNIVNKIVKCGCKHDGAEVKDSTTNYNFAVQQFGNTEQFKGRL